MSVKEAQSRIDSREFVEWQAYYHLEPFGEWRADVRTAQTIQTMAALKGKKTRISDFMLFDEDKNKAQSPEDMKILLKSLQKMQESKMKAGR